MFTKEIKLEAREMLKKDDNLYFPGIWLMIIPTLILVYPMEEMLKGGKGSIVGFIATIIMAIFSCWFINWISHLIYNKKTIMKSFPKIGVLIPYIIISLISAFIVKEVSISKNMSDILLGLILALVGFIISLIFSIFMEVMVIDSVKNEGRINYSKDIIVAIKAIPKVIILNISFIPLYLLIGITFGILMFWKVTYMETSCVLLISKIYDENN